jgi:N6-adenosine-specific RNA methylase IME4
VTADLKFHPLADIFPLIEGAEFSDLVADIRTHGLHEPVVLFEGKILDGRNRYRACVEAGTECRFETYQGKDPVGYVVSLNLRRRHLNESQRAMVAAKLATMKQGARTDLSPIGEKSQADAAMLLNVGKRSVERAAEVRESGAPELVRAVERGDVSVSAAADVATMPLDEQREVVARGEREILQKAQEIRARKTEVRRAERIAMAAALGAASGPLPQDRKWPLILADPPWRYDFSMTSTRAIEAHYPTLTLEQVCALPVTEIAASSAILFLWVPSPILKQGFEVIEAWGFEYCAGAVWRKDKIGEGFYFRSQHEHLLVGKRGDIPPPPPSARPPSIFDAPRREHSRKPDEAYVLIERMYPELPKIELFARQQRPGWDCWGNEVPPPQEARESWGEMWAKPFDFSKLKDHGDEAPDDGIPAFPRRTAP